MEKILIGDDDLEWSQVKRQHFFKVLIGEYRRRLRIPPKFVKHIDIGKEAGAGRKTAMLEGPAGRTWYVSIENATDGMFFTDGWPEFVQDHGLKEQEFLLFCYNGSMHFSVLIFDTSACEKEDFGMCNGRDTRDLKKDKLDGDRETEVKCTKKRKQK